MGLRIKRTILTHVDGEPYMGNLTFSNRQRCTLRPGEVIDIPSSNHGFKGVKEEEIRHLILRGYFVEVEKPKNKGTGAKVPKEG